MDQARFDGVTRSVASGLSRRASLRTVGGAMLAGLAAVPVATAAAKKGDDRCKKSEGNCLDFGRKQCRGSADPSCFDVYRKCCKKCYGDQFVRCVIKFQSS